MKRSSPNRGGLRVQLIRPIKRRVVISVTLFSAEHFNAPELLLWKLGSHLAVYPKAAGAVRSTTFDSISDTISTPKTSNNLRAQRNFNDRHIAEIENPMITHG
jgi:hypothetical protein